jgi:hypothetical protein
VIEVRRVADANYNDSPWVSAGTLTVNPANQAAVSGSLGSATISFGGTTTVTASGGSGIGAYEFRQNGGTGSVSFTGTGNTTRTINTTTAGTAVIEVRRVADANYNDSPWVSAGTLTVYDPDLPIAVDDSVTAAPIAGNVVKYAVAQLLSNDQYSAVNSSKAGLTLSIGLNTLSSNGGKVSKIGNWVVYQPSAKAISSRTDSFTYTLGNGSGKTASGTVSINLGSMPDFTLGINIESVQVNTNGPGMIITFAVSPSKTFAVEGKTTLSDPWRQLGTKASETDGRLIVVDPGALSENGFYRVRWIP